MNNRKPFFGANWKMNKNLKESKEFFLTAETLRWGKEAETVFFPPSHLLLSLKEQYGINYLLGAQNFYFEDQGAYTGEISSWMLKEESIKYAIIGHSERRIIFGETNEWIAKKVIKGLENKIKIIFCVGETLQQRENGEYFKVLETQLTSVFSQLKLSSNNDLIIAYEPVWAIGTGKNASPEQAQEIHQFIRDKVKKLGFQSDEIRIIYGGSVKPENIKELMSQKDIDGALVGGASLNPQMFNRIVNYLD